MADLTNIREKMPVYGANDQLIGTVERRERNGIYVNGRLIDAGNIARIENGRIYLSGVYSEGAAAMTERTAEGGMRVPVYEERLDVEKRQGELGEVQIRKTVEQEQVAIPVELRREQVHVEERDIEDRPVDPGQMADAFKEGTIRVPVRGEEAIVEKQAYVTGEVVVSKDQVTERQQVTDTVRRERVHIDEDYQRARPEFERHFTERQRASGTSGRSRTFTEAETNYRTGFEAAYDERYAGRSFDEVEPDLRRDYERRSSGGDPWQHLREEIREGYERVRRR
jgi:uncharacterized protein (TIGR02271 family)